MRGAMIRSDRFTFWSIYPSNNSAFYIFGQHFSNMYRKVVFLFCIDDNYFLITIFYYARIPNLAPAFGIKWSFVKYQLVEFLSFGFHLAVLHDIDLTLQRI